MKVPRPFSIAGVSNIISPRETPRSSPQNLPKGYCTGHTAMF
jgi:hypothetical protein